MVYGIICEFNPFHKGHKHLIDSIKNEGDAIICAMSGNFVQRGEFAAINKFDRAAAALKGGADLIIEIPTPCSLLSAQGYAEAGVKLLEGTGICEGLAFGTECESIDELLSVSKTIKEKDALIKEELSKGFSYPQARQNVIGSPVLEGPNNILALEYLACTKLEPFAVKRIGLGHDSTDTEYSAAQIRKTLVNAASLKNCEKAVLYKLRTMSAADFAEIEDVTEGLENRIVQAVSNASDLNELYALIKSKRYTHSRIRRIIMRAFLGIKGKTSTEPKYLRILGFNEKGRELLSETKKASPLPIITGYADAKAAGGEILEAYEKECFYTNIYNIGFKKPLPCGAEQKAKIVIY